MHFLSFLKIILYVATLMFIFMPRVFVPCLYSLSWIWGGGTESWDSISIVLLAEPLGMGRNSLGWGNRSVTMLSCLQTDHSEFSKGKGLLHLITIELKERP